MSLSLKRTITAMSLIESTKTTVIYRNLLAGLFPNQTVLCNSNADSLLKNQIIIASRGKPLLFFILLNSLLNNF